MMMAEDCGALRKEAKPKEGKKKKQTVKSFIRVLQKDTLKELLVLQIIVKLRMRS